MKKLNGKIKKVISITSIASLLQTPVVAYAQSAQRSAEIMNTVTNGLKMYGDFLQVNQQQKLQQLQNQQMQKQLQSLAPTFVSSKIFPECPITPSMSNTVKEYCYADANPTAVQNNTMMKQLADSWVNTLNQVLNTASNGQTEIGIQCLQNRSKSLDDNFQELVNNLIRLKQQLNTEKENFRKMNIALLDEMKTIKSELSGGKDGQNLDTKSKDYTSLFSKSCQSLIADKTAALDKNGGFLGISSSIAASKKLANDHNQNKIAIEKEIRSDVQKAADYVKKHGIQALESYTGFTEYPSVRDAQKTEITNFSSNYGRIKNELAKLEYEVPALDKNFNVDLAEFTTQAKDYFKKRFINQCVTGADKTGITLTTDQILASLKQKSTNNKGTAAAQYRVALENIVNSDTFIQDKVNQIRNLENTYKDISVTYRSANGQTITSSPYDLYIKQINLCEQQYASSNAATSSEKKKVDRGVSLLNELQNLSNNFATNFITNSLDAALNCNGKSAKNGVSGNICKEGTVYNFRESGYCLASANECANVVVGCDAEITNQITIRKNKQKSLAATYNVNMQNMINKANALVKAQNAAVMTMMKKIQAKLPGTNIEIPEEILIKTPDMMSTAFDVALIGNGSLDVIDEIDGKIALLQETIQNQRTSTIKEVDDYIKSQHDAMKAEQDKWSELYSQCQQAEADSARMIAEYNQKGNEAQAQQDADVGNFCRKYGALRNNPMAGCGKLDSLSEDMGKIIGTGRITNKTQEYMNQYAGLCSQYNNESDSALQAAKKEFDTCRDEVTVSDRCKVITNAYNKQLQASDSNKSNQKKLKIIKVASICGSKDRPSSNKDFISKISGHIQDNEIKKKAKSVKDLDSLLELSDKDGAENINNFFASFNGYDGLLESDNFCKDLYKELYRGNDNEEVNKSNIATTGQNDNTSSKTEIDKQKSSSVVAKADEEQTKREPAAEPKATSKSAENSSFKAVLNEALAELAGEENIDPEVQKSNAFSSLGEQIGSDCDTQLANNSAGNKGNDFLKAFDASILGSGKTK